MPLLRAFNSVVRRVLLAALLVLLIIAGAGLIKTGPHEVEARLPVVMALLVVVILMVVIAKQEFLRDAIAMVSIAGAGNGILLGIEDPVNGVVAACLTAVALGVGYLARCVDQQSR